MKRNVLILCLLTFVIVMAGCGESPKKDLTDRDVLVLIFKNLNGANWPDRSKANWNSEEPVSKWNGVKVDENDRVTELRITVDSVKGIIPAEIGLLTELKTLAIRGGNRNMEEQPFPASIGDLTNLESLSLYGSIKNETGIIFPPLGNLAKLTKLDLSGAGKIPEGFGRLASLKDFEFNGITGNIPADLGKLTNLERIFIRGSEFTGSLPSDIGNLKKLTFLLIDKSQFIGGVESLSGELPESLWNLTELKTMFLRRVCNGGTLSPKIANLSNITQIDIVECGLTGEIPKELYTMTKLKQFEAYSNKLTGGISSEIGNMTAMETFWVNNNQLSGTLPAAMGKMTKLKSLKVENNQFTGAIPAELANCPLDGVFVDFTKNQFSKDLAPALKAHATFAKWKLDK